MGQYHHLMCLETRTYVDPHPIGAGMKAREQIWSHTTMPSALALLCACNTGQHNRDIPWAAHGAWAGKTPIMVGDYAEDGDLVGRNLRAPESTLGDKFNKNKRPLFHPNSSALPFASVSNALVPVMERVHGHRCLGLDVNGDQSGQRIGWADFIPVRSDTGSTDGWALDLTHVVPEHQQSTREYFHRVGIDENTSWRRPPMNMSLCGNDDLDLPEAPDFPTASADGAGEHLLWVNLDRGEFLDPAVFGDTPDLVGIMNGKSAGAVQAMLFHHELRGGGDIGNEGALSTAGRWRGDRIALIGAEGIKVRGVPQVTQASARETFCDVSSNALCFFSAEDVFGVDFITGDSSSTVPELSPKSTESYHDEVLQIAMKSKSVTALIEENGFDAYKRMSAIFIPPLTVSKDKKGKRLAKPVHLAPRFDLRFDTGKIWMDQETRMKIARVLARIPAEDYAVLDTGRKDQAFAPSDPIMVLDISKMSNHALIRFVPALAA